MGNTERPRKPLKFTPQADVDIDIVDISRRFRLFSFFGYYRRLTFLGRRTAGFVLSLCFPFSRSILFLHFSLHRGDIGRDNQLGLIQSFQQAHFSPRFVL